MTRHPRGTPPRPASTLIVALAVTLSALLLAPTPGAHAVNGVEQVAAALRDGPVYVDPRVERRLPNGAANALAEKIEDADKPVLVAVLPATAQFPARTLLQDLRAQTGVAGVYAVVRGDGFDAGADRTVMSPQAVAQLTGAVERAHRDDTAALLDDFTDQALRQAEGRAPADWSGGGYDSGRGVLLTLAVLLALGVAGGLLVSRRRRSAREARERAALAKLRPVVEEDITAFGEELRRVDFDPAAPDTDATTRDDYGRALDCYDRAKTTMASARRPADVRAVSEALGDGRFALSVVEARREGRPLPDRRTPCFFDPRHGPSVTDAPWTPEGGTERLVPVCAADEARLADGREPLTRTVDTAQGPRPYWEAGPVYGPWAGGYFGGALLPGLLMGTMLGSTMGGPYGYGGGWGEHAGTEGTVEGGDSTGSTFEPGDFGDGGGFGGGGDFGGGGF